MTRPDAAQAGAVVHELLDPDYLRTQLTELQQQGRELLSADDYREMQADLQARRARATSGAGPDQGSQAFLPNSFKLSLLQSTLTACVTSRAKDLIAPLPPGHRSFADFILRETDVFKRFGPCDAGWIESVISKGISLFEHKPPFVDGRAPTVPVRDHARIVVVGDWGTGLKAAQNVGTQMGVAIAEGQAGGREVHALHLGDVYYSGWKEEYQSRFMPYWPAASPGDIAGSWSLNGNHDMYSGGQGYFGYLLEDPRFAGHAGSSYFALETSKWRLLGLDSAYKDADLAGHQAQWVAQKMADGSGRKTMLLSHHQPYSAFADGSQKMVATLAAAGVDQVDAWLWGHEHLCCVYEPRELARFGTCIGHGGVPVLARQGAVPAGVKWFFGESEDVDGDAWQVCGFAVLDIDDEQAKLTYWDEHGPAGHVETLP